LKLIQLAVSYRLSPAASAPSRVRPKPVTASAPQAAGYCSLLTVNRLRPFALRRFKTNRPFFVLIRTRNP
jgi:hypothetical protein